VPFAADLGSTFDTYPRYKEVAVGRGLEENRENYQNNLKVNRNRGVVFLVTSMLTAVLLLLVK
jgi:hypothetical protein